MVQLLDKDGDGVADATQVAACLARATAEANSALQIVIDLSTLSAPYADSLVYNTAELAAFYAWQQGGDSQTMPDNVRARRDDSLRWFDQIVRRERTLGVVPKAATGQQAEQVDRNPFTPGEPRTYTWRSGVGAFW